MSGQCLGCGHECPGSDDTSTTWFCGACGTHGASKCLVCRSPSGFPKIEPLLTLEEAARSPLSVKMTPESIRARSLLYCEWCLHGAYFTVTEGRISQCLLCDTTWNRLRSAAHAATVAARGT